MPTPLTKLQAKRPKALKLPPETPLTAHFSSYQMGPLTPAPLYSPPPLDTFDIDPLTPSLARPPMRPFPSMPPPSRPANTQQLIQKLNEALMAERTEGSTRILEIQIFQMLGYSKENIDRYLATVHTMREEQSMAREGDIKSALPLYYLLLALSGNFAIRMGATFLEHEVLPGQPKEPGSTEPGAPPPGGGDPTKTISNVQVMGGAMLLAAGSIAALGATYLFWRQARIKRPKRAACLAAAHITSLALAVMHSFLFEYVLFNKPGSDLGFLIAPQSISAMLYAYTVPNSLTAAETQLGLMPLGSMSTRMELALIVFAFGQCLTQVSAGLAGQHGVSPYVKQAVTILGSISSAGGIGLAFSSARNFEARLERGRTMRERAAQHSVSDQGRRSSSVRRPTALPAQVAREVALLVQGSGSSAAQERDDMARPMLHGMPSDQSVTPLDEWPSPSSAGFETITDERPVPAGCDPGPSDYFNRQHTT